MSCHIPHVSVVSFLPHTAARSWAPIAQALKAQTFPWFEWIVATGGADLPDNDAFCGLGSKLRVLPKSASLMELLRASKGEVVLFLDGSILPSPQLLEHGYWGLYYAKDAFCCRFPAQASGGAAEGGPSLYLYRAAALLRAAENIPPSDSWPKLNVENAVCLEIAGGLATYEQMSPQPIDPLPHPSRTIRFPKDEIYDSFTPIHKVDWAASLENEPARPHFLLLAPWMVMGGADRFNYELMKGLREKSYELSIITTLPSDNPWRSRFLSLTPDVYCLPDFLDRSNFASFLHYYIRSRNIDILMVSNSAFGYYVLPWLRAQFPDLVVVDYVHMPEKNWRSGGYARLSGYMAGFLDMTYTCNQRSNDELVQDYHHSTQKTKTIYVGVDHRYFSPPCPLDPKLDSLIPIPVDRPFVLFPCRLAPQKRPFLMLAIAKKLHQAGSPVAFVVAGDGPDQAEMESYIQHHNLGDTVFLIGPQDDLRLLYEKASLTLICSLYEGLSLTAYESMAMGTPVITSDVGGQAELVSNDMGSVIPLRANEETDTYARTFDRDEIEDYVSAISQHLEDHEALREKGRLARARITEAFTLTAMVERMDAEFGRLLADKGQAQRTFEIAATGTEPGVYEELAILAAEFAKRETLIDLQRQQLAAAQSNSQAAAANTSSAEKALYRVADIVDKVPGLRRILPRYHKNQS